MKKSVLICTYNGERFISSQIKSIINQSISPDEIVVCDDISDDKTIMIVKKELEKFRGKSKVIINEHRLGVTKNFENGIKNVDGDIIFLSDQDDVWHRNKIENMSRIFEKDEKCVVAFSNASILSNDEITTNLWKALRFFPNRINCYQHALLKQSLITGATMVVRRDYCMKVMPFPKEWIHDGWLAINAKCYGNICKTNEILMDYRVHNDNIVGVNYNFNRKIKSYLLNVKLIKPFREERYRRYQIFYLKNKDSLNVEIEEDVKKCIFFWKNMRELDKRKKIASVKCIIRNLACGNYNRYYTGIRGAVRDFISII